MRIEISKTEIKTGKSKFEHETRDLVTFIDEINGHEYGISYIRSDNEEKNKLMEAECIRAIERSREIDLTK